MGLSKRERVIRTLERDGELDIIPIQNLGFELNGKLYQEFLHSDEYKHYETHIKNNFSNKEYLWAGDIIVGSGKYESLDKVIKKTARFINTKESLEENVKVYEKLNASFVRALVDTDMNERVTGEI